LGSGVLSFNVQGLSVFSFRFRFWGLRFRVAGVGFQVSGFEIAVSGFGFWVSRFWVLGVRKISGFGCKKGVGCRV